MVARRQTNGTTRRSKSRINGSICKHPPLDSSIWASLPDDLHKNLLEHLPLPSLCRFRKVCKSWHAQISQIKVEREGRHGRWYIRTGQDYNTVEICNAKDSAPRWPKLTVSNKPFLNVISSVSSNGLILCFTEKGIGLNSILVYNPLIKHCVELPAPPQITENIAYFLFVGIQSLGKDHGSSFEDSEAAFIVVCVRTFFKHMGSWGTVLQAYDSREGKWSWSCDIELEVYEAIIGNHYCHSALGNGVLHDFKFYFQTMTVSGRCSLKYMPVLAQDKRAITLGTWTSLPIEMRLSTVSFSDASLDVPGSGSDHPRLALCNGKLLTANMVAFKPGGKYGTVCLLVWNKQWEYLSILPKEIIPRKTGLGMDAELVIFGYKDELAVCDAGICWGCVYNFNTGIWTNLPGIRREMYMFFPYQPSFLKLPEQIAKALVDALVVVLSVWIMYYKFESRYHYVDS